METRFYCHDGCQAPVIARKNRTGKWELYTISKVQGMGLAEYNARVTEHEYDELVGLNSFSGTSYIATRIKNQWGLIEIRDNGTAQCAWRVMAENRFESLDAVLSECNIDREKYDK